jgi:cobalt-zinc-cadmium efflux system protein
MSDAHDDDHGALGHSHAPKSFGKAFAIGTALNLGFVIIEAVYGIFAHSLALIADAGHNFSDVVGLLLAWGATVLAQTAPTKKRTYGMRSSSILAALLNALLLLVAVGGIASEAIRRFSQPAEVAGRTVIAVALIGIVINGVTALLFASGRKGDVNIRGAFLHMVADAAVSAGVVASGFAILWTGFVWIDPVVSLAIAAVITWGTWGLLRESLDLSLDAVPKGIDVNAVEEYLRGLPGITRVHDLHIWAMSTTETALTAHLVKPDGTLDDPLLMRMQDELHDRFGIEHMTVQFECGDADCLCAQEPAHAV